ncbi:MAG: endonuclease [Myxococcota bacterium]|nr:endonuclease [Myxococcota bacterium]
MRGRHHQMTNRLARAVALCLLLWVSPAFADSNGYYAGLADEIGQALKARIHALIVDHHVLPYSSHRFDVRDAIEQLDESPHSSDFVRLLYGQMVMRKSDWPDYNREHVWPQSLGAVNRTPAHTDLHHIFACDANVNSARGNRRFDECTQDCNVHPDAPDAAATTTAWEPPDDQKGDIARALFYMDVRYEGDRANEPDLRLVEWGVTPGCNCMGRLSTLLRWHTEDPVDLRERDRNDAIFELQGNRNPFVDNPEWVARIWDHLDVAEDRGWPLWDPLLVQPWFNEIHYENAGQDVDEGFEIAGPAGTNLLGWSVALYNGRDQRIYAEVALEGTIDDEQAGFGALWFSVPHVQNGGSDGMALIDPSGQVVTFISYEGQLHATDGPANTLTSVDIGIAQDETTHAATSLQLHGDGGRYEDFDWVLAHRSPGRLNAEQELFRSAPLALPMAEPGSTVRRLAPPTLRPQLWWFIDWQKRFGLGHAF